MPTDNSIAGSRPKKASAGISQTKNLRTIRLHATSAARKTAASVRKTCSRTRSEAPPAPAGAPAENTRSGAGRAQREPAGAGVTRSRSR